MVTALVVDDDPLWLDFSAEVLGSQNVLVETCAESNEAFERARTLKPQVIVLDVLMPGIDGFQLLWRLVNSEETAGIPVVILSGRETPSDVAWGQRMGAYAFLSKRFGFENLANRLVDTASAALNQSRAQ